MSRTLSLFVALGATLILGACSRSGDDSSRNLVLSGNIEVTDAQLGFKIPGRVVERAVSEGDRVKAGQLVARLDDAEQVQQLALRKAELAGAEAALAELKAGSRPEEIAATDAALRNAEAERDRVRLDFARQSELHAKAAIADREFEAAQAGLKATDARVEELTARAKLVHEGPRAEDIQQAAARVQQALAAVALAQTQLDYTRLYCPLSGFVLSHNVEPGEYVSPGTPVVTVANTGEIWVRAYVAQPDLGRLRLGQKLVVHSDAFPGRDFEGTVGYIASEAEFTPKTVQTTKERVKLVFRIKVYLSNPKDELKPGMPADVLVPAKA